MNDALLYEKIKFCESNLPITCHYYKMAKNQSFQSHWHDQIELLYVTKGEGIIQCNSNAYLVRSGDLIVVNSNELHQGTCTSDILEYNCIIFDESLLQGRIADICETKYISSIFTNRILFQNKIDQDKQIKSYIDQFTVEYEVKNIGYELLIKAIVYQLLVYLLRFHVLVMLSPYKYEMRMNHLIRFNPILEYIEAHYSEKIAIDQLCAMAGISRYYFCRLFKEITGKSLTGYLNTLRVDKAAELLKAGDANVTEAALACGFNDINYFCRIFKKYRKLPPSSLLKQEDAL